MSDPLFSKETLLTALKGVKYPGYSRDIVSFGIVKEAHASGSDVFIKIQIATKDPRIPQSIQADAENALKNLPGVGSVRVLIDIQDPPNAAAPATPGSAQSAIEGVKHVIAVASGKGGVGKSTVASNLAATLSKHGKTGLCDCDLYGPSIGLMFGSRERATASDDNRIFPVEQYGIKLMSMGFLLEDEAPAVLRGPMVTRITQQFLRQVAWEPLDYLILDLPPGTGDIQLTIVQTLELSGAIIVTTPQEVALIDARKAAAMFEKTNVPVLGLVENMSYFECPSDGVRYEIFGSGGGEREAARLKVPLLGRIPIDIPTREAGDRGCPIVLEEPAGIVAQAFAATTEQLLKQLPVKN